MDRYRKLHPFLSHLLEECSSEVCLAESQAHPHLSTFAVPHSTTHIFCVLTMDDPVGRLMRDYRVCAGWRARKSPIEGMYSLQRYARLRDYCRVLDTRRCKSRNRRLYFRRS